MKKITLILVAMMILLPSNIKAMEYQIELNGEYNPFTKNEFPNKIEYILNRNKTVCSNGASFNYDKKTGEMSVVTSKSTICNLSFEKLPEFYNDISGANAPNIEGTGLIPVRYDEEEKEWKKTNTEQINWYNYSKQMWANAVATTSSTRSTYLSAPVGTVIEMEDILGMYVWIPRYEYMYTNLGEQYAGGTKAEPGEIKINFIEGTSLEESDDYIIHPAFRDGSTNYTNNAYTTDTPYEMGGWDSELTGFGMESLRLVDVTIQALTM